MYLSKGTEGCCSLMELVQLLATEDGDDFCSCGCQGDPPPQPVKDITATIKRLTKTAGSRSFVIAMVTSERKFRPVIKALLANGFKKLASWPGTDAKRTTMYGRQAPKRGK